MIFQDVGQQVPKAKKTPVRMTNIQGPMDSGNKIDPDLIEISYQGTGKRLVIYPVAG